MNPAARVDKLDVEITGAGDLDAAVEVRLKVARVALHHIALGLSQ